MQKLKIPYAEFYITNVCNLACNGCNRFNNYNFRGFQQWEDHAEQYRQWAQEINIGNIGILGGEPLLNPTFMDWVTGISKLWPNSTIKIITNGFQLAKVRDLYQLLESNHKIRLWVGIHNKQHKREIIQTVKEFTQAPHTVDFNSDNYYRQYMTITDANGVCIQVEYNWWFHQGAIVKQDNELTLHNSDPEQAHAICHMKTCHHFIRGKLYKCGVVALLPEFAEQHKLTLSNEDKELLNSYRPLSLIDSNKAEFIDNLNNPIDQCKFCPAAYHGDQIWAQLKKNIK